MNVEWDYSGSVAGTPFLAKLPQSAWCFEPAMVLDRVGTAFSDRFDASECRIVNVQHKPRRSLDLVYEFSDKGHVRQVVNLRFVPPGRFSEVSARAFGGSANRNMVRLLEPWNAITWLLPEDPGMPLLGDMLPINGKAPASFDCLPPTTAAQISAAPTIWSMLSYRAGDRATIRIRADGGSDVVAKMHASAGPAHQTLSHLWQTAPVRDRMSKPLAVDEGRQIRWERFVDGSSFDDKVAESGLESAATEVIAGLVDLHSSKLGDSAPDDASDTHRRLVEVVLKRIDRARLPVGPACHRLAKKLGTCCPRPNGNLATIHSDFHTSNIIFSHNRAIFIDLDGVRRGDPVFDLALFGSRLLLIALMKERPDIQSVAGVLDALPEMYERQGGVPIERSRYAWFLAALLVTRQIKTCITNAAPDITYITSALGAAAETLLNCERLDVASLPVRNGIE